MSHRDDLSPSQVEGLRVYDQRAKNMPNNPWMGQPTRIHRNTVDALQRRGLLEKRRGPDFEASAWRITDEGRRRLAYYPEGA